MKGVIISTVSKKLASIHNVSIHVDLFDSRVIDIIMPTMGTYIILVLYNFVLTSCAKDVTEGSVVHLNKDSFAGELEKMPHFVLFSYPPSSW